MPSWKKVILSGSDAALNSLNVTTNVTASSFTGSFIGSFEGTASYATQALSASYVATASYTPTLQQVTTQGSTTTNSIAVAGITNNGNLFLSGSNRLIYNNSDTNSMLFGFFDGSNIYGPYYQIFGNNYSNVTQRGSAEFVFDTRNGGESGFNVVSFNGLGWTRKFRVDDNGVQVTGSVIATLGFTGSLLGTSSYASQALSSSYAITSSYTLNALSASYTATASSANQFNVRNALTASGLIYPTTDGTFEGQVIQTNASGTLSFGDPTTTYETIYNGEATSLIKGTPVYVSGSNGANPKVYAADASNAAKMPVVYIVAEEILTASTGRGILLGTISGINLTGYTPGDEIYAAPGGGWTSTRPTGAAIVQLLGIVTKEGVGGKGLVLNPGPATLPNLTSGSAWVGDSNSYPVAVPTASFLVNNSVSASHAIFADTASFLPSTTNLNITSISASNAVFQSASIGYLNAITGSATIIGDAYVVVNSSQTTRYAGLAVYESGSVPPTTASWNFDSQTNDWFYEYSGSDPTNFGVAMFGPEYNTKGSPIYLTNNRIPKGNGGHHLNDSNISDNGSRVSSAVSLTVTGSISSSADASINSLTVGRGGSNVSTNTVLGSNALISNTTGTCNTAVGFCSLQANTYGCKNVSIGMLALGDNTTGRDNVAVGTFALRKNTYGTSNTAAGHYALSCNTTGQSNTAFGNQALAAVTTAANNTALGSSALQSNTGALNTAIGSTSMLFNTTGICNTAVGFGSLQCNTTGTSNVAVGFYALQSNRVSNNIAVGTCALRSNTTGVANTSIGTNALKSNTTGWYNTAVGSNALTTANGYGVNTAVGADSMKFTTTGCFNSALGDSTLYCNTTGFNNTALGSNALRYNTTGCANTAVGVAALRSNTTGLKNTAVGVQSGQNITIGACNTVIGYNAGCCITTGAQNVVVGSNDGNIITTSNCNIILSDGAGNIRMFITGSNGNIALGGNTNPQYKVDISGSLGVSADTTITGSITNVNSGYKSYTYTSGSSVANGTTNGTLFNINANLFQSITMDYVVFDSTSSNKRAGTLRGTWDNDTTAVVFDETTTTDIGNTSAFTLNLSNPGSATVSVRATNNVGSSMTIIYDYKLLG